MPVRGWTSFPGWPRAVRLSALALALSAPLALGVYVLVGRSIPLLVVAVQTTYVSYDVQVPDLSAIAFRSALVTGVTGPCAALVAADGQFTARVTPSQGTQVEYVWHRNFVQVKYDLAAADATLTIEAAGSRGCEMTGGGLSVILPQASLALAVPLPLLGRVEIGNELPVPPVPQPDDLTRSLPLGGGSAFVAELAPAQLLQGGSVTVFGQSSLWHSRNQVYPVPDAVYPLPRGGRLVSAEGARSTGTVGFGETGFDVDATVSADQLLLYRPGADRPETFGVGVVSRAFSDPGAAPWLVFLGIWFVVLQLLLGFAALGGPRDDAGD